MEQLPATNFKFGSGKEKKKHLVLFLESVGTATVFLPKKLALRNENKYTERERERESFHKSR